MSETPILIERSDGGISILYLRADRDPFEAVAKWEESQRDRVALAAQAISREDIPTDRTFREAWAAGNGAVVVDMPKAREIHLANLRVERNALLEKSDVLVLQAREQSKDEEAIATVRTALRDMPSVIAGELEAIGTPEELKAFRPAILDAEILK